MLTLLHLLITSLSIRETVMARTNRASCLHRLGRLDEAVRDQERAIRLHLNEFATQLLDAPLTALLVLPAVSSSSRHAYQDYVDDAGHFL